MSLQVGEGRLGSTPDADTDPGRPVWAWHSQTDLTIIPAGDPSLPRHPLATLVCRAQRWPLNWQYFIWMPRWSSGVTHTSHNTALTTLQLIVRVCGRLGWLWGGWTFIHLFTLHVDVCGLRRVGKHGDGGGGRGYTDHGGAGVCASIVAHHIWRKAENNCQWDCCVHTIPCCLHTNQRLFTAVSVG